jgi:ATP-binding protein involved in chromosome partitioning
LAHDVGVPLLGKVPIDRAVAIGGDDGEPVVFTHGPAADALNSIIDTLVAEAVPPVAMESCSARMLDAVMAALDAHD